MKRRQVSMDVLVILLLALLPGLCDTKLMADMRRSERQISRDLALGGKTAQSSTFNFLGLAKHAVDGNRNSNFLYGSCTHTNLENNPWWRVDLMGVYKISRVTITNRGDCCGEWLSGAQIRIGNSLNSNGNNNELELNALQLQKTQANRKNTSRKHLHQFDNTCPANAHNTTK
uniref:Fucolectin tachylectin-4 pentraxin-1 domain-containing protein n=1 Tax=Cyprinus carpio carpio TaxID=630221 RepID=A0A9J8CQ78_CYPCA